MPYFLSLASMNQWLIELNNVKVYNVYVYKSNCIKLTAIPLSKYFVTNSAITGKFINVEQPMLPRSQ